MVWTESKADAARMVALPEAQFPAEIARRFGCISGTSSRGGAARLSARPLYRAQLYRWRLALVGDAAHVIHPIAGQGLNMGLRDVAALAEASSSGAAGLGVGAVDVLDRYQRWRRFDNVALMAVEPTG